MDLDFETNPLVRTLANAGVASEEELQQSSESEENPVAAIERELDSATAQLAAVRDRFRQLVAHEERREQELRSVREQNGKLREARLADAVRIQALETQLAERNERAAAIAEQLAEAARALGAS